MPCFSKELQKAFKSGDGGRKLFVAHSIHLVLPPKPPRLLSPKLRSRPGPESRSSSSFIYVTLYRKNAGDRETAKRDTDEKPSNKKKLLMITLQNEISGLQGRVVYQT